MAKSIRTTVSIPDELHAALNKAAESSHVSTAWVIREALRCYLGNKGLAPISNAGGGEKGAKKAKGS